jgi:hypothetical protein
MPMRALRGSVLLLRLGREGGHVCKVDEVGWGGVRDYVGSTLVLVDMGDRLR